MIGENIKFKETFVQKTFPELADRQEFFLPVKIYNFGP